MASWRHLTAASSDAEWLAVCQAEPDLLKNLHREAFHAWRTAPRRRGEQWDAADRDFALCSRAVAGVLRHYDAGPPYHPDEQEVRLALLRNMLAILNLLRGLGAEHEPADVRNAP